MAGESGDFFSSTFCDNRKVGCLQLGKLTGICPPPWPEGQLQTTSGSTMCVYVHVHGIHHVHILGCKTTPQILRQIKVYTSHLQAKIVLI